MSSMWKLGLVIGLCAIQLGTSTAGCPCSVADGKLTCAENTIQDFPEDLNLDECHPDLSSVWAVEIQGQPISILKNNAFERFSHISQLSLSFNEIKVVEKNAFAGLNRLTMLFMKENDISIIKDGALDHLINLKFIDLRLNEQLEKYTTNSWHFCTNAEQFSLFKSGPTIFKEFTKSPLTDEFCEAHKNFELESCDLKDTILDCSTTDNLKDIPCYLSNKNFERILFNFKEDPNPREVANFYEGESNRFFQEFNSQNKSMEHLKYMNEFTLYETKFDISKLNTYTSTRTQKVIIKADTVYMSAPVTINYKLELHARVVSLQHPIQMSMTKDEFLQSVDLESWAAKEEYFTVGKVLMNRKQQGLVTIVRNIEKIILQSTQSICHPNVINVEESGYDIQHWYDVTSINLNYVCARTVLNSRKNAPLVQDISTYMLGFVYNDTIVKNREAFIAAQKYNRLLDLNSLKNVHNVPSYSVDTIAKLSSILFDKMTIYKQNEIAQESQLFIASGRVQDMQIQFQFIEQQQKMYFEAEQRQLDAIWASADTNWHFDFSHRNDIENEISGGLDAIQQQMWDMEQKDLENALREAELSREHIAAVVEKFETQVKRLLEMTEGSINVQSQLVERLKTNAHDMDIEFQNFERAIEQWKHEQEVKAVWGIFKAILSFGIGLATGELDPAAIGEAIEAIIEIEELLIELVQLIENCNAIQDMINEIDFSDIADINLQLNTNFKDALHNAVEMKLKGPDFDEIERTATIKIGIMNQATNNEIEGADNVMMACTSVSDVGHQLINEASDFADKVLQLSERNDELIVARQDMNRTVAEIEHIRLMLIELKQEMEDFMNNRDQAREEYEQHLKDLEEQYNTITAEQKEEFRKKITESFLQFQTTFRSIAESYNNKMYDLLSGIHQKFYGLKEHSMNQRSMIMSLFIEYCDADFYHSFTPCDDLKLPLMSDELDTLLDKLKDIEWNSITSSENIPGTPIEFSGWFVIQEDSSENYGHKNNYIVETLKSKHEVDINLRDLDVENHFDDFWRVRLERLTLVLLDANNYPIQSNGTSFGKEIQIRIQYPTIFNDTDNNGDQQSFLALNFACNSDYVTSGAGKGKIIEKW